MGANRMHRGAHALLAATLGLLALTAGCGKREGPVDPMTAFRSRDPAVAGPVLFAETKEAGRMSNPAAIFGILAPSIAARVREQVEKQIEEFRKDPVRAAEVQQRMALSKSPADMSTMEYLTESGRIAAASGVGTAQAEREVGRTYVSARLEAGTGGGPERLIVIGERADDAGAKSQVESVFVWEEGRWGYDPEASRARNASRRAGTPSGK
jgi:hypothetical protein